MKKTLLALAAAAILALPVAPLLADVNNINAHSNAGIGGVGVGDPKTSGTWANTYLVVTGVTEVYDPIPLTSILTGTNGTTALADTAITTGLYVGTATGMTNHAGVIYPVELDTASASIPVDVPWNYRSGGHLVIEVHTNSTFTAGTVSITADAYAYSYNADTTSATVLLPATAYQVPTSAAVWGVTMSASSAIGLTPGGQVTYKLKAQRTSAAARLQVLKAWFAYRPYGLAKGR